MEVAAVGSGTVGTEVTLGWNVLGAEEKLEHLRNRLNGLEREVKSIRADVEEGHKRTRREIDQAADGLGKDIERIAAEHQRQDDHNRIISKRSSLTLIAGIVLSSIISPIVGIVLQ